MSGHVLNLRNTDLSKKELIRKTASTDLREEIKAEHQRKSGRICIIGETPRHKQGLGRAPVVLAAFLMVLLLSAGQVLFLGQQKGEEALALAGEALTSLQSASESVISGEPGADSLLFQEAEQLFNEAEAKSAFLINYSTPWLTEPSEVRSLRNLLEAGELMAEVGLHIASARSSLTDLPDEGSLTEFISSVSTTDLEPAAQKITQINTLLEEVDLSGTGYEDQFESYREKLNALTDVFDLWLAAKDPILTALGDRYPQHYLILLMNNDEMRMGGGFIGSFALAEINDGRMTDLDFHDVYEFDNLYYEHIEMPVHELEALSNEWRLRDSNISPDFPESAEHAIRFLDLEGGPGVDGVIGVNLSAAQSMIEELGSLQLASLPSPLTAETFPVVLSTLVEAKVYGQHSPKDVLGELIDAFIASATSGASGTATATSTLELQTRLALTALEETRKKQILFYHRDESVQDLLGSLGLYADLPQLNQLDEAQTDFFMPVFTNIGGNKTDRYMQTDINHATHIFEDGSIANAVTLTRTHTFTSATLAWLKQTAASYGFYNWNSELQRIMGNDKNKTGIRLYFPENSQVVDVSGTPEYPVHRDDLQFYYDTYEDISYYYLDQEVQPGTSQTFTIIYSLPWAHTGEFQEYEFQLFQQPGLKFTSYTKTVTAPDDIMLSSEPLATSSADGTDYIHAAKLQGDLQVKLLYR